jgi:hypothetical protein
MNVKVYVPALLLAFAATARAQELSLDHNFSSSDARANARFKELEDAVTLRSAPARTIGKSDFTYRSPLIDGLVREPQPAERPNLAHRVLRLPIIRLFVPMKMAEAPPAGTGSYFAWRSGGSLPWTAVATGDGAGRIRNEAEQRPVSALISVGK